MIIHTPDSSTYQCSMDDVRQRINNIDVRAYDKSRNHLNGAVTWLSPLITHGITSAAEIAAIVVNDVKPRSCYRLLYELAWREYFHRVWEQEGDSIFSDLGQPQHPVCSDKLPKAIVNANTTIEVVDACIEALLDKGLMHNHARMWTAAITCNMAQTHWNEAARWMHFHLLDGDLASNTLSWQWIAGTNSAKKYVANQDNVNKYSGHQQTGSWLDVPYEAFDNFPIPDVLSPRTTVSYSGIPDFVAQLSAQQGEVALRSVWQLDPRWQQGIANQIVFVDVDQHKQWPMSANRWELIRYWATQCKATLYKGTVNELNEAMAAASVIREEYTACDGWPGKQMDRQWLYPKPVDTYKSFSQFFKQVKSHVGL